MDVIERERKTVPADGTCNANLRNSDRLCSHEAGWGTDHLGVGRCKLHGGCVPHHRKQAMKLFAKLGVKEFGLPVNVDPHTALLEELHRTAGIVAFYEARIRELEEGQLHGPVGGGALSIPREEPHVWIRLHQEERSHLVNVAAVCIKSGIEERRIKIAEQQGQLLAGVIRGVLEQLKVDTASAQVRAVIREHLTTIEGNAVEQLPSKT
jgi:hypothetical protein